MHLKSLSSEELISSGVSEKFARILADPESYHPELRFHIGTTDWDYYIPDGVTDVVPLWDMNADSYASWRRNGITEYVLLFHDDRDWSLVAQSEQGVIAELWNSWAEMQEDDNEVYRFAEALGFRYCAEALRVWEADYDKFQEWKLNLRET